MKRILPLLALLLGTLTASANESLGLRWWRLEVGKALELKGEKAVALRTLEDARAHLRWQEGVKTMEPAWLVGVDFEKWMVVLVPCRGNAGARWDVVEVTSECKEPTISLMRQQNADGNKDAAASVIAVLMPLMDGEVLTSWRDGDLDELAKERDCRCSRDPNWIPGRGNCPECGEEKTTLGKSGVCPKCAEALQECFYCGKRIPGAMPLKEDKK